ncbi:MBL fold metallo-hydrolase [Akkermansiaceae bacterium]|jgi:phosphoribosyl 1,2-cyclic phosphodiesterase|nr:MBL fold metallo-hydrolase [Akkermansiaceae bacterium]
MSELRHFWGQMRFAVLGSGSGGNATLVESEGKYLLVDAGLSSKQLCLRLEALGVSPGSLTGILLTHEHGDHVRGLDVFLTKWKVPLVASIMTGRVVQEGLRQPAEWVSFESGQRFTWEGFDLETFALPHDAVEPVGYVISNGGRKMGVATDLGHVDDGVMNALKGVEGLVLEANYEWKLLEADTKRPFSTKQRISSQHGHLSNEQAADLIAELVPEGLKTVILGHLSSDCNTPDVAIEVVRGRIGGDCELALCCAGQHAVTEWQSLIPPLDPAFYGELFGG